MLKLEDLRYGDVIRVKDENRVVYLQNGEHYHVHLKVVIFDEDGDEMDVTNHLLSKMEIVGRPQEIAPSGYLNIERTEEVDDDMFMMTVYGDADGISAIKQVIESRDKARRRSELEAQMAEIKAQLSEL